MADIGEHSNIVKMIGACSNGGTLIEYHLICLCEHAEPLAVIYWSELLAISF